MGKLIGYITLLLQISMVSHCYAQCPPVFNNRYDTLCSGDALFGHSAAGVYNDTFHLGGGCDSIRVLTLTVIPKTGFPPDASWFNTGNNGSGGRLAGGSNDLHWQLSNSLSGPYAPAIVISSIPGSYYPSPWPDCTWISHTASAGHSGNLDFYYKIDFILPCLDSCTHKSFDVDSTFRLTLDFFADNSVYEIYVNGVPQSPHIPGIPVASPYGYVGFSSANRVTAHMFTNWKRGYNSLVIRVASGAPYEGFLAQASTTTPPPPVIHAAIDTVDTSCAPYNVSFVNKSTGVNDYTWDFGDGSPQSTAVNPTHTYTIPGVYVVSLHALSNNNCILQQDSTQVTVVVSPPFADTSTVAICSDGSYMFNGTSLNTSGIYTATYTTIHGCDSIHRLILIVNPAPLITDSNLLIIPACKDIPNGKVFVGRPPGDTISYTYTWKTDSGNVIAVSNNLSGAYGGHYTLDIITRAGCKKTLQVTIPEETIGFSVDTLFCVGDKISFQNNSSSTVSCTWYFGDSSTSTDQNPTHTYTQAGVYKVLMVGTGTGCTDSVYHTIIVEAATSGLNFTISRHEICIGEKVYLIPHAENAIDSLLWNFGAAGTSSVRDSILFTSNNSGMVIVQLSALSRICPPVTYIDTLYIDPYPMVNIGPDTSICLPGAQLVLYNLAANQDGYSYLWSTGETGWQVAVNDYGLYWLTVTSAHGCATTDSADISKGCYLAIPNAFTPNGDGVNDYFFPRQFLSKDVVVFSMQIYNRWGQTVFETASTTGRGWDGKFNGQDQMEGVYVYIIDVAFDNGAHEKYKGNITLLR